jgi:hypothetical protein
MELRGLYFPQIGGKINPGLHPKLRKVDPPRDGFAVANIFHARFPGSKRK